MLYNLCFFTLYFICISYVTDTKSPFSFPFLLFNFVSEVLRLVFLNVLEQVQHCQFLALKEDKKHTSLFKAMKDFGRYSQPNEVATDTLGLCLRGMVSSRRWARGRMNWQTDAGEVVLDLYVICQIEHRLFMQKTIRKLGDIPARYKWGYQMLNDSYTKQSNENAKNWQEWVIK